MWQRKSKTEVTSITEDQWVPWAVLWQESLTANHSKIVPKLNTGHWDEGHNQKLTLWTLLKLIVNIAKKNPAMRKDILL